MTGDAVRVRIDLSYDGTHFAGWAAQQDQRTVQGELEKALAVVSRREDLPRMTVAGRTDSGVHARGQVAHIDLPPELAEDRLLLRRLNGRLPDDIQVRAVSQAPAGFDARFAGLSRTYVYRVADRPSAVDPLRRRDTLEWPRQLDLGLMQQASVGLVGLQDFTAYCKRREGATTVRTLLRLAWVRQPDGVLEATVQADAFCHSMVRSLVGALLAVGDGRREVDWPAELLGATQRATSVLVAPAHGLTLIHVEYPPDDDLLARQEVTRRFRPPLGT